MSIIFKKRSPPKKHLIIREEYELYSRGGFNWRKAALWLCLLALLIWLGVSLVQYVAGVA